MLNRGFPIGRNVETLFSSSSSHKKRRAFLAFDMVKEFFFLRLEQEKKGHKVIKEIKKEFFGTYEPSTIGVRLDCK